MIKRTSFVQIMNNSKHMICNNCCRVGHLYHQCKLPITSFGVILFRHSIKGLQFLMIRRKDSFGYIDFIRGKYLCYNIHQTQKIVDEMSLEEKQKLLENDFEKLWKDMWGDTSQNRNEEVVSQKKFDCIKNGVTVDGEFITLKNIIDKSETSWTETEWEFPKGRRNFQEKDLECALREFEEETGLNGEKISVIENLLPFDETFIGSNHKCYKHKYFLAYMKQENDLGDLSHFQVSEVSKLEWKTFDECLSSIRPYHLEKKRLLNNVHKMLQEYRLYA